MDKKLNIQIVVDPAQARRQTAKFVRDLKNVFRMLKAPVFQDLTRQMERVQVQAQKIAAKTAGTRAGRLYDSTNVSMLRAEEKRALELIAREKRVEKARLQQIEVAKKAADKYYSDLTARESKYRAEIQKTAAAYQKAHKLLMPGVAGGRPIEMTKAAYTEEIKRAQKYQNDYIKGWQQFATTHNKQARALEQQWSNLARLTGKSAAALQQTIHPKDLPMAITQMEKYHMLVKQHGEMAVKTALAAGTMTTKFKEMGGQMTAVERGTLALNREFMKTHGLIKMIPLGRLKAFMGEVKQFAIFQMRWFAGAGLLFGAIATLRSLISTALNFSQTLKDIQAVTGATAAQMNMIAESAKRIANTTPMAAEEASQLGLQLIRAGIEAADAAKAMEVAAKVAVVSGEQAKTVADTIATAMMAWKLTGREAKMVGNTIAASMNFSRLQVEDLGTAFNYLAGVASSFNWSFQETNAILSVYSNIGVRASTISTGLVQLLSEFVAPSRKARAELERLGISLQDLNPVTHKYSEILRTLEKSGFNAAKSLDIFQTRAGRSLMFALRAGSEAFEDMERKIRESKQLTEGLEKAMEGPTKAFRRLWNVIKASAILVGEELTPAIRLFANTLSVVASGIYHVIHLFSRWYGQIALAIGATALLYKRLMVLKISGMVTWATSASKAFTQLAGALYGAATGATSFGAALQTIKRLNPLVWLVSTGVGLAGLALLDKFISRTDKSIEGLVEMQEQLDKDKKALRNFGRQAEGVMRDVDVAIREFESSLEDIGKVSLAAAKKEILDYAAQFDKTREKIGGAIEALNTYIDRIKEANKASRAGAERPSWWKILTMGAAYDPSKLTRKPLDIELFGGAASESGLVKAIEDASTAENLFELYARYGPAIEKNRVVLERYTDALGAYDLTLKLARDHAKGLLDVQDRVGRSQAQQIKEIQNSTVWMNELKRAVGEQATIEMSWGEKRKAMFAEFERTVKQMQATADRALPEKLRALVDSFAKKLAPGAAENFKTFKASLKDALTLNETDLQGIARKAEEAKKVLQEAYFGLSEANKAKFAEQYKKALRNIGQNANVERLEATRKTFERHQDFYKEIAKASATATEQKLMEVDAWGKEQQMIALALDDWTAYFKVLELVAKKKKEIFAADKLARGEAEITFGLGRIDLERQRREISEATQVSEKLRLNEKLLGFYRKHLQSLDQNTAAWFEQLGAITGVQKEVVELHKRLKELTGTFNEGILEGLQRYKTTLAKSFEQGVALAETTARSMEQAFSDFFFDAFQGKLESLGDYLRAFLQEIQKQVASILSQRLMGQLMNLVPLSPSPGKLGNFDFALAHSGGLIMHDGGMIPRYHGGGRLAPDERVIIAQTNERVMSREQSKMFEQMYRKIMKDGGSSGNVILINAVDAPSFVELCRRNPSAILGPVMEHRKRGGDL